MSNIGQIALAIVGAVIGVILAPSTGGASLTLLYGLIGAEAGMVAGTFLFPTMLSPAYGPQLTDHNTTSASLGDTVAFGYGTFPVTGTVIWLDQIVETTTSITEGGGSGGPESTTVTYTYTQSIAIGLCEGPITGLLRVWENGELVYDVRPQQIGESSTAYSKRFAVSQAYAETFVLYLGTEDQTPDPTISLIEGVENTPAFRGLSFIVFPKRLLRSDQALRHPSFKYEIFETADFSSSVNPGQFIDGTPTGSIVVNMIAVDLKTGVYFQFAAASQTLIGMALPGNEQVSFTTLGTALGGQSIAVGADGFVYGTYFTVDPVTEESGATIVQMDSSTLAGLNESLAFPIDGCNAQMYATGMGNDGTGPTCYIAWLGSLNNLVITAPMLSIKDYATGYSAGATGVAHNSFITTSCEFVLLTTQPTGSGTGPNIKVVVLDCVGGITTRTPFTLSPSAVDGSWTRIIRLGDVICDPADGHVVMRITGAASSSGATPSTYFVKFDPNAASFTADWITADPTGGSANYDYTVGQSLIVNNLWMLIDGNGLTKLRLQINVLTGVIVEIDDTFLPGIYTGASMTGAGVAVVQLSPDPAPGFDVIQYDVATPGNVSIAGIMQSLALRSGVPIGNIDVSSITTTIPGFVLNTAPMAARDAAVPLRSVGFFDMVESDSILKFVQRGGAIAATLTMSDIGAFDDSASEEGDTPAANTVILSSEIDLPQQLRVRYIAVSRDYQPGTQLSPTQDGIASANPLDVSLGGVILSDDQAAQVAEINWSDAWSSYKKYSFVVDQSWAALEPTDIIQIPLLDILYRVRIISIDDANEVLRTITASSDDDGNYVSSAVANPVPYVPTMRFLAKSSMILLDSPLLVDSNDTNRVSAPLYSVVYPDSADSWAGAVILESDDAGVTYKNVAQATTAPATGAATTVLGGVANAFLTDTVNSVTVKMRDGAVLPSSITTLQQLAGGNPAIMLDADGSVEVFQFRDVTIVGSNTVTLSYLIRGRRGTDTMTSGHDIGSRFIMLDNTEAVEKITLALSDLDRTLFWKAVGSADAAATVPTVSFSSVGRSLMPYAPVHLRATSSSGDILINATRRARIGASQWVDGETSTLPLAEDSESYSLDIYKDGSVIRTINGTSLPITYLAADVTTDFGSIPAYIDVALYQLSGEVGRGFAYLIHAPMDQDIEGSTSIPAAIPTAVAPSYSPGAGAYTSSQIVTLTSPTVGASIYYTLDGSTPTSSGTLYGSPITVGVSETLRAIAVAAGYDDSGVSSAVYTIVPSGGGGTAAATPVLSPVAGIYGATLTVSISTTTSGATIYYTIDGTTPTVASPIYSSSLSITTTTTVQAIAVKSGLTNSPIGGGVFLLQAAIPSISPPTGPTGSMQTITIVPGATPSETIYYTTDGTTPSSSNGTVYTVPFSVDKATTVQAIAYATGFQPSTVATNFLPAPPSPSTVIITVPGGVVPDAAVDVPYELPLLVTGIVGTPIWTIQSGSGWENINSAGIVSGTPLALSLTPTVVRCTDSVNLNFGEISL